ncbi:lysophospholipid acyltransferase family protein [Qingshengfaniella alkalisoli]|uniref:Acyltransferase n=1 Tax=Qingshengfaniella alkalisoli TaxID=2599296 RepID=A0A5B8I6N2_9RHOB|nr:lysophospholipid acyltransferase family protein [Qingshengfaniella alkalisoli]QDY69205.1 acyltransferase [Qingshengfaniella alkalisoli]
MAQRHEIAREISYAHSARSRSGRAVIRAMENASGRLRLVRRANGYDEEVAAGRDFWRVMLDRYNVNLRVVGGTLDNIPREGPLVVMANHPFGILDGLLMGHILSSVRDEYRILAHQIFRKAEDINRIILPVSFDETREATRMNLQTRSTALEFLGQGGAIGVFPGGTVSTSAKPFLRPMDPAWRTFTAKMVSRSGAQAVPVFFDGHNSRIFQLASHLHCTLRMGLLISEFRTQARKPVDVVIGKPIPTAQLDVFASNPRGMMDFLRQETYRLSPVPLGTLGNGFEFEKRYKH